MRIVYVHRQFEHKWINHVETGRPLIRMFGRKIQSRLLKDKQDVVKSLVEEDDRRQGEGFEMGRVMSVEQTVKHCFNEIVERLNYVKTSIPPPTLHSFGFPVLFLTVAPNVTFLSQNHIQFISLVMFTRYAKRRGLGENGAIGSPMELNFVSCLNIFWVLCWNKLCYFLFRSGRKIINVDCSY